MPTIWPGDGERSRHNYARFPVRAWFEYHCEESETSADARLWHHTHEQVTVLRQLTVRESDFEMYEILFQDGTHGHVMSDELMCSRLRFCRPDYPKRGMEGM